MKRAYKVSNKDYDKMNLKEKFYFIVDQYIGDIRNLCDVVGIPYEWTRKQLYRPAQNPRWDYMEKLVTWYEENDQ